jgi:hypothetical protein
LGGNVLEISVLGIVELERGYVSVVGEGKGAEIRFEGADDMEPIIALWRA